MAELRGAALSILGVEIGGNPLVGLNLDALNTLFVAMMARISEFQAKVTRLEAELESKTSKAETSALREKMRNLPTTEDIENLTRAVDAKAAKGELDVVFEVIQELKARSNKLEIQLRSKSNRQEMEMIHSQISYLQESLVAQEQEISNVAKSKSSLPNASGADTLSTTPEEGQMDPQLDYADGELETMVNKILADHPVMSRIEYTISDTHTLFDAQQKEIRKLRDSINRVTKEDTSTLQKDKSAEAHQDTRKTQETLQQFKQYKETEGSTTDSLPVSIQREQRDPISAREALSKQAEKARLAASDLYVREDKGAMSTRLPRDESLHAILDAQQKEIKRLQENMISKYIDSPEITTESVDITIEMVQKMVEKSVFDAMQNLPTDHDHIVVHTAPTPISAVLVPTTSPRSDMTTTVVESARLQGLNEDVRLEIDRLTRKVFSLAEEINEVKQATKGVTVPVATGGSSSPRAKEFASQKSLKDLKVNLEKVRTEIQSMVETQGKELRAGLISMKEMNQFLEEKADEKRVNTLQDAWDVMKEDITAMKAQIIQKADKIEVESPYL
ncbi:putative Nucleotide-binding head-stalk protein [Planoprotostelium fungivorum]|uniref:Putative Nucleotide-binding head-stalk protein n=1 Tax=Planoprotostelium fungivorum TaxID=1890364 RepID=A0A2P6MW07_9EUKA|nr:putative Nucleotide-binding head-stalk protein [Planoprotostelium fungivorum]